MSTENISIEQHLTFVNKMRERVRGTDLEPIWDRLHAYMTKINDLNDEQKRALDEMIKKVIAKIEHFKKLSEQRLEAINAENKSDHEIDAQFETSPASELTPMHSQSEQTPKPDHEFVKPSQKVKKLKRFRMPRQTHPHIVMSPRGDNIPVMRIRLSEILNKRRQKEEKKKKKKTKDVDVLKAAIEQYERSKQLQVEEQQIEESIEKITENQPEPENSTAVEHAIQNSQNIAIPMEVERINEISTVHDTMNMERFSNLGLKDCSVRIDKCLPEKVRKVPATETSTSTQAESVSINNQQLPTELEKIPIEKSKTLQQNGSTKIDEQQFIYIVDSDDDDNMPGQAVQNTNSTQTSTTNLRLRKKSQLIDRSVNTNTVTKNSKTSQKSPKTTDKSPQNVTKNQRSPAPKKPKLEPQNSQETQDSQVLVTVKTVDLLAKPQKSTDSNSKSSPLKAPTTPNILLKPAKLLQNVTKSAPAAKFQAKRNNRFTIDTMPDTKLATANSIRQSARQAIRRNSIAKTINFEQPSPVKSKNSSEKSNFIKILSVETLHLPGKNLEPQLVMPTKKLQNARKSTKSNSIKPTHKLPLCNQTPNNNNLNQVTAKNADHSELPTNHVNSLSDHNLIPSTIIKNEPQSPKGYMTPPMTEIPTSVMISKVQNDKKLVLLTAEATLKKLRPWLKTSEHRKLLKNCENMLGNGFCLSALFKCMGSTCSYYTNNSSNFLRHLKLHQQKQSSDMKYFSQCAYCSIIDDNPEKLIKHILDTHGYSGYQCAYCFYRSCDFQIHTHHKLFHPLKSEVVIECQTHRSLDMEKELSNALSHVMNVCKPVCCCVCKFKFYNIKNFEDHFKAYPSVPSTRCLICKIEITQETIMDHLKECHKFGDFNCAFCSHASDSSNDIRIHLSNVHYDKPMLYYDRTKQTDNIDMIANQSMKKEDVLRSIVLKQLIHQEQSKAKNIKIFNNQQELENSHGINTGLLE